MKRLLVCSVVLSALLGCATTSSNMNSLNLGMTKQQVVAVMGEPTSVSATGETEYLIYHLYGSYSSVLFPDPNTGGRHKYFVRLRNGLVDSYGRIGDFDSVKGLGD